MSDPITRLNAALEGRYRIESELGEGGMGTVYLANDLKHNRTVAIKVIRAELASSVGGERFLREVEIAAGLVHPHIVPLYDSGDAGGMLYYVMPHVAGPSLKEYLQTEGQLPVDRALAIARDVADGLAYAHDAGFVHRDIKPGNILVAGGHGLIVDFGVARAAEVAASDSITLAGAAIGTPAYMSPEQFSQDGAADARSDIYSLGCVLYGMLCGRPPFEGRTPAALFAAHLHSEPSALETLNPDVPAAAAAIVKRMLAKDPAERFQTAAEVTQALTEALAGRWAGAAETAAATKASRLKTTAVLVAVVAAIALGQSSFGTSRAGLTLNGGEASVVVLPFHDGASTDEEKSMLIDLAGEVTRQLNRWESVRAVPQIALAGISFDLSIREPTLERVDEGLEIAAQSGVGTLVSLTGRLRGDSAVVTATQFDVATGRSVGRTVESSGDATDRFRLGAGLVHAILGLEGTIDDVEELRRQSANPEALVEQADGRRALESWRLPEAESAFRAAIEGDSTFAMAHHYLALTLYWQAARETSRLASLGPEIARESFAAVRHSAGLPAIDSVRADAFYRLQQGDYESARSTYRSLISRDPTDVYALLLLGTVEYRDPWLVEKPDGSLGPRGSLNTALNSFREAVRLSPGFHLGYGHLFDITSRILGVADSRAGLGFERPRDEQISLWERQTPFDQISFYAVSRDTLAWLRREEFDALDDRDVRDGADRLLGSSMRTLRRWADFAPTDFAPVDQLAEWTLRERSRLPDPTAPATLDSMASVAESFAGQALEAHADTLATELLRLGNLRLATGDVAGASELIRAFQNMLDAAGGAQSQPRATSNLHIYRGQPSRAVLLLARESASERYYAVGDEGELIGDGGANPTIQALRLLAAAGVSGEPLDEVFERLDAIWSPSDFTLDEVRTMRSVMARFVAPALALAPERAAQWLDGVELADPIWAVVRSGPVDAQAGALLLEAAVAYEYHPRLDVSGASRAYILGRFAQRIGRHEQAIQHFARIDSIPLSIRNRDLGWGLLSLSYLRRAEAYAEEGDSAAAAPLYRKFLDAWEDPDDLVPPLREQAREALGLPGMDSGPPDGRVPD